MYPVYQNPSVFSKTQPEVLGEGSPQNLLLQNSVCKAKALVMQKGFSISGDQEGCCGSHLWVCRCFNMPLLQSLVCQPALTGLGGNMCKIVRTRREAYVT